ncbi:Lsr2 family protein [Allokutzneria sp. A3M-2-11 16]|uniref:histone-like nucleoid-structuring protein Lsr2 n=1 Tax=Allokutzneria sp. A3M-2-11 16 TaxID=2962043 RepID=UPI0020B825B3|nr:Lsr2 family protein [Allokutzneria sp. A3M-2-11 16]MCP3797969.1 Lsr2 family protein [Allokutzneria sp. A3M-2-11 16]
MAQRTIVQLVDDLDGTESGDISRVEFALDGITYEIDLNDANVDKLRNGLAQYVEAARRVGGRAKRGSGAAARGASGCGRSKEELQEIREWARSNGHEVSERGRIATSVLEAYDAAKG